MLFFRAHPPIFLPKRPKKSSFLLSVRFWRAAQAGLGVDGARFTEFSEIAFPEE